VNGESLFPFLGMNVSERIFEPKDVGCGGVPRSGTNERRDDDACDVSREKVPGHGSIREREKKTEAKRR